MGKTTEISWTGTRKPDGTLSPGATFNSWWGCTKISPGCTNCYADTLAHRWGMDIWGPKAGRRFFGDKHWNEPVNWNKAAEKEGVRRKVFCGSMMDWTELRPDLPEMDAARTRLFRLIETTPWLDWLLLTKRPERIPSLIPMTWLEQPRPNVWMGTSTENQAEADKRIPELLKVPAVVRFLSAEPLLSALNLRKHFAHSIHCIEAHPGGAPCQCPRVNWVIVGGESGPGARPMDPLWARDILEQCRTAAVAYFFKQGSKDWGPDFKDIKAMPLDLQVQDFPTVYPWAQVAA